MITIISNLKNKIQKKYSFLFFKNDKKGFTLVELLVVVAIFLILIGAIIGIFISGVRKQRLILTQQTILDQTSFVLEYMSRSLRMATKELSAPSCLSQNGLNYEITHNGTGLRFINFLENNDCQEFFLQNGQLRYWKRSTGITLPLTPDRLEIIFLRFNSIGAFQGDDLQPRITISFEIRERAQLEGLQRIRIQTTISQRNLDVQR